MKKLILIALMICITFAQELPTNSIVKVYASITAPNYKQPWRTNDRVQLSGSGVLIEGNYIITSAHVVSDAKFIQVSSDDSSKKYIATTKYISHQADLALLQVSDKEFYKNRTPLKFNENIETGDSVTVLGYPIGGNALSTTKGTISRIEPHNYVWSNRYMLCIQIDAAINSGNSGGAALDKDHNLVGIVMQSYSKDQSDNIGYIVPSMIVNTFLEDIKDGKVDGFDNTETGVQNSTNKAYMKYHHIKKNQGARITKLEDNEDALKAGDILIEIEGNSVLNDGNIYTQYGQQSYRTMFDTKPVGQTIKMKVLRDGKLVYIDYTLKKNSEIIKYERNKDPRYMIFGGMAFCPVTKNYLFSQNFNPTVFEVFYKYNEETQHVKEGVMVLSEKFDHAINEGYRASMYLIKSVNGTKVVDFNHFVKLLDESKEEYIVIDFLDAEGSQYIFNTKEARNSFEEIKHIYGLTSDRRVEQ